MGLVADALGFARFAWELPAFLRYPLSLEDSREIVRRRLAERESNFLQVVERCVFGHARSPYLPLFELAQVELGDIRDMVQRQGLESTLRELRRAGVYVTFEEFKGREPIVRHGRTIPVAPRGFDNPWLSRHYQAETGGTSGAPTRVYFDLEHMAAIAPFQTLAHDAHGVLDVPTILWRHVLPAPAGIGDALQGANFGNPPRRWFTPLTDPRRGGAPLRYRLVTRAIVLLSRLYGVRLPWPEPANLAEAQVVARAVVQALESQGQCLLRTFVSMAARVALAAGEAGLDLTGAVFMGGGEPPTPGKVRTIEACGAKWVPSYFLSEAGPVGFGCGHPADGNDLHFGRDSLALIQYPRRVPGTENTVDAFHFTILLPTTYKVLINVETDDYGVIERRSCGCPLEAAGFTEHLREVRSFSKLTGEGMTLVGSDMVHVLDEVLPAHFGGSPLDYQLLEEEDERGLTRLHVVISPRVHIEREDEVVEVVLDALRRRGAAADLAQAVWAQAGALRVRRAEPVWTARGKLTPLGAKRAAVSTADSES
ncbi:MAG: hypothetical protein ACUVX9_07690 [Anaerolineae bacterium]